MYNQYFNDILRDMKSSIRTRLLLQECLLAGLDNKQPKIVITTVQTITLALRFDHFLKLDFQIKINFFNQRLILAYTYKFTG